MLDFFLRNPQFEYYWYIESDVRFTGSWKFFFENFDQNNADFISTYLEFYWNNPKWHWWKTLKHPEDNIPLKKRLKSFNPVYRISYSALNCIHNLLINKWQGHHEVLLPTLLYREGFKLNDIGGEGPFVTDGNGNRFYTSSTFRWRPIFKKAGEAENKLYHPVK